MSSTISPVRLITPRRFGDSRGWFAETYSETKLAELGIHTHFVQDNHSMSSLKGTIRGIHFQTAPYAQAKLVRCLRGSIMDYAVDLRSASPTYGEWTSALLSADNGHQLYIPVGFGHAFITLEDNTEIAYKVSAVYAPECDGGVVWNDPQIAIDWPLPPEGPTLSEKDMALPRLHALARAFDYNGCPLLPLDKVAS